VADGHGGVFAHKEYRSGLANDVAASHDHGFLAGRVDAVAVEQLYAAPRGAGQEHACVLYLAEAFERHEAAYRHRVESVHILVRAHGDEHFVLVEALRERQLHEYAVDAFVVVEFPD